MQIQSDPVIEASILKGGLDGGMGVSVCLLSGYCRWLSPETH